MAAPVDILPPDRPIFMIGQPIIRLFAPGGPGSTLGDIPQTWRSTVGMGNMGCCGGSMPTLGDLGCCDDEDLGMGSPFLGADNSPPEKKAKALVGSCKGLDAAAVQLEEQIKKISSSGLSVSQKQVAIAQVRGQIKAFRKSFKGCLRYLKGLVQANRKRLEKAGLSDVVKYSDKKSELEACRAKVAACQKRYADHMRQHHGVK